MASHHFGCDMRKLKKENTMVIIKAILSNFMGLKIWRIFQFLGNFVQIPDKPNENLHFFPFFLAVAKKYKSWQGFFISNFVK